MKPVVWPKFRFGSSATNFDAKCATAGTEDAYQLDSCRRRPHFITPCKRSSELSCESDTISQNNCHLTREASKRTQRCALNGRVAGAFVIGIGNGAAPMINPQRLARSRAAGPAALGDIEGDPARLITRGPALAAQQRPGSECMRRPVKQFELSGQCSDTPIPLGAREVGFTACQPTQLSLAGCRPVCVARLHNNHFLACASRSNSPSFLRPLIYHPHALSDHQLDARPMLDRTLEQSARSGHQRAWYAPVRTRYETLLGLTLAWRPGGFHTSPSAPIQWPNRPANHGT